MPQANASHGSGAAPVATEPNVAVRVVEALWKGFEQAGVARSELLSALGGRASSLGVPDARVPLRDVSCACELALQRTNDPALGLRWVKSLSARTFSPISHLLAHAGNLRQAFALMSQYEKLFCDQSFCELREHGKHAELRVLERWSFPSEPLERFTSELTVAGFLLMVRDYGARDGRYHASFRYARPAYADEYVSVLGPSVRFGQPFTGLVFERALLDVRPPHSDDDIHGAMRRIADRRLLRATGAESYVARVNALLRESLPSRTNMSSVARVLGISVRSLRRHLADEGTSFRQLEGASLAGMAECLLREERLTIQETAYAMGFSDATTFHRAFKQWTGKTPSAFRAKD